MVFADDHLAPSPPGSVQVKALNETAIYITWQEQTVISYSVSHYTVRYSAVTSNGLIDSGKETFLLR